MDFNADLSRCLRYSMEPVANLIQQLASDDHRHTRWGTGDHIFRGVLADAIDESDRPNKEKESALLRTEGQHVLVDGDGRIRPAKFDSGIGRMATRLDRFIERNSHQEDPIVSEHIGWHYPVGHQETGAMSIATEDHGDYDVVHMQDAGNVLADAYHRRMTEGNHPILTNPSVSGDYHSLLNELRNAPYEEIDLGHSSERDNGFGFDDPNARKY